MELDDMFVPIAVETASVEALIDGLSGINLMDGTTLRNFVGKEEKKKGPLSWAFRHPVSCECEAPEIEMEEEGEVIDVEDIEEEMDEIDEEALVVSEEKTMVGGAVVVEKEDVVEEKAVKEEIVKEAAVDVSSRRHYDDSTDNVFTASVEVAAPPSAVDPVEIEVAALKSNYDLALFVAAAGLLFAGLVKKGAGPVVLSVAGAGIGWLVEKRLKMAKAKVD